MIHEPNLTARIREEALRLGFFKIGIAAAGELPWRKHFENWLAQGMHGKMAYLERQAEKRKSPELVLGGVRSILVFAMNYHADCTRSTEPLRGRISRYAWGEDYHDVLAGRLDLLLDSIKRQAPAADGLCYADAGPVMEKVWGAHSALGWMGKHSNLITRSHGSWFFIGVILLNLELACDTAERDYCGTCRRCIRACPTGAIVAPYQVDARLCISYLTIELRGLIAPELRPLIGNRIFGCDDCQEACPWNRFAVLTAEKAFRPRAAGCMPELAPLVSITEREFADRFRASPVRRARREGLVRNVVIALGNSHDPEAIPALKAALHDISALVRRHAAWALGQIKTAAALQVLREARKQEPDAGVMEEIEDALMQQVSD